MRKIRQRWQFRNTAIRKKRKLKKINMTSASEEAFFNAVEELYKIKINRQFPLDYRFFDGQYGMVLIECDGERWHSRPKHKRRDALKDEIARKHGFKLYRIKLNRVRDVPQAIEENKQLLSEIFDARQKLQISPTE